MPHIPNFMIYPVSSHCISAKLINLLWGGWKVAGLELNDSFTWALFSSFESHPLPTPCLT